MASTKILPLAGSARPEKENPATSVERTLAILEAVAERHGGMTNAEISRLLDIPKSSAVYILRALEQHRYLRREETGKYKLGMKVLSLGRHVLVGIDVREVALPVLRHIVEQLRLTAHLAILDGSEAVYIEKVDAPGFIKMDTWVGKRMEIHTTSVGKALAAFVPEEEIFTLLKQRGLLKATPKSITTFPKLARELEKIRQQGYAVDDEENNLGARCVGAPIFNEDGKVEASIGVSGTTAQTPNSSVARVGEIMKEAANRISVQLGFRGSLYRG